MAQFKCFQCGGWFDSMWGDTCNGCRKQNQQHQELVNLKKKELELKQPKSNWLGRLINRL